MSKRKRHQGAERESKRTSAMFDSPMRPVILGSDVELLSKPSMVSYREWEIRRSWLSSREFTGWSNAGGLPGAYRDGERDKGRNGAYK